MRATNKQTNKPTDKQKAILKLDSHTHTPSIHVHYFIAIQMRIRYTWICTQSGSSFKTPTLLSWTRGTLHLSASFLFFNLFLFLFSSLLFNTTTVSPHFHTFAGCVFVGWRYVTLPHRLRYDIMLAKNVTWHSGIFTMPSRIQWNPLRCNK